MGSYSKAKGRSTPKFVLLRHDMMDSPAWLSLSSEAQALWCHLRRRYNGENNGDIPLACREAAEKLNIGKGTAAKAFGQLQDRGFLKIGEHSSFAMKIKKSRRWIMTHEAYNGQGPTNEWRQWGKSKLEKNRKPNNVS